MKKKRKAQAGYVKPTEVELRILEVFWRLGPSTVRTVHLALTSDKDRKDTGYSTTLKMIQVMADKGLLSRDSTVRPQVYTPTIDRESTQQSMLQEIKQRLFGGDISGLVQCAISSSDVSEQELKEAKLSTFQKLDQVIEPSL